MSLLFVCFFFLFLRQVSCHVPQAGLTLVILLLWPPECWNYREIQPAPALYSCQQVIGRNRTQDFNFNSYLDILQWQAFLLSLVRDFVTLSQKMWIF
jgi:hypothetical protein